jgi:hypothetical protein
MAPEAVKWEPIVKCSGPVAKPIGSLKLDKVGVFAPQKLVNAKSGLFFFF